MNLLPSKLLEVRYATIEDDDFNTPEATLCPSVSLYAHINNVLNTNISFTCWNFI